MSNTANKLQYTLVLNDIEKEIATEERVIEYAKNRLIANAIDVLSLLSFEDAQIFISEVVGEDFNNWNNTKNKGIDKDNYKDYFSSFIEGDFPEHLEKLLDNTAKLFVEKEMILSQAIEIIKSYDENVLVSMSEVQRLGVNSIISLYKHSKVVVGEFDDYLDYLVENMDEVFESPLDVSLIMNCIQAFRDWDSEDVTKVYYQRRGVYYDTHRWFIDALFLLNDGSSEVKFNTHIQPIIDSEDKAILEIVLQHDIDFDGLKNHIKNYHAEQNRIYPENVDEYFDTITELDNLLLAIKQSKNDKFDTITIEWA